MSQSMSVGFFSLTASGIPVKLQVVDEYKANIQLTVSHWLSMLGVASVDFGWQRSELLSLILAKN